MLEPFPGTKLLPPSVDSWHATVKANRPALVASPNPTAVFVICCQGFKLGLEVLEKGRLFLELCFLGQLFEFLELIRLEALADLVAEIGIDFTHHLMPGTVHCPDLFEGLAMMSNFQYSLLKIASVFMCYHVELFMELYVIVVTLNAEAIN